MIESLLIANRGEIACRIIRTARRLGIRGRKQLMQVGMGGYTPGLTTQGTYRFNPRVDVGGTYTVSRNWGNVGTLEGETVANGPVRFDSASRAMWSADASNYRRVPNGQRFRICSGLRVPILENTRPSNSIRNW